MFINKVLIYMRVCGITYTSIMSCSFHVSIVAIPILFNDAIIVDLLTEGVFERDWRVLWGMFRREEEAGL